MIVPGLFAAANFAGSGSPVLRPQMIGRQHCFIPGGGALTRYWPLVGRASATSDVTQISATEADVEITMPFAGTFRNLRVTINQAVTTASSVFLRVNGANSALTVTIPANEALSTEDITHSVHVDAGDLVCWSVVKPGTQFTSQGFDSVIAEFIPDTENAVIYGGGMGGAAGSNSIINATINYVEYHGNAIQARTAYVPSFEYIVGIDGHVRDLNVRVRTNTSNASSVFTLYKNGVATALTVTIPAGTTGLFSDTTHQVTIAPTDQLHYRLDTTGRSSGGVTLGPYWAVQASDDGAFDVGGLNFNGLQNSSENIYGFSNHANGVNEVDSVLKVYSDGAAITPRGIMYHNTAAAVVLYSQRNGVDTGLTESQTHSPGTYNLRVLSGSEGLSAGDTVSLRSPVPSSSTNMRSAFVTLKLDP